MPERMILCWKCRNGNPMTAGVWCDLVMEFISDFKKPPEGCPVKKQWEEDDAKEKETRS